MKRLAVRGLLGLTTFVASCLVVTALHWAAFAYDNFEVCYPNQNTPCATCRLNSFYCHPTLPTGFSWGACDIGNGTCTQSQADCGGSSFDCNTNQSNNDQRCSTNYSICK